MTSFHYSTDIDQLVQLCEATLLGRRLAKMSWHLSEGIPCFNFEPAGIESIYVTFAPLDWLLINANGDGSIITTNEVGHRVYKQHFAPLVDMRVSKINIDVAAGLALRLEFENGMHFQLARCERIYDDFDRDCWSLACIDAHVLLVGGREGQWQRIHKAQPVYGPPPTPDAHA